MGTGIDCKLSFDAVRGQYDLALDSLGDIETEDSFSTAILVSLFTDARASADQVPAPELRRGWIGNERTPGFQMGGLLWLFDQARLNRSTANEIEDAAEGALRWMVDEGYAKAVRAKANLVGPEKLTLDVFITQPQGEVESLSFDLWKLTGEASL